MTTRLSDSGSSADSPLVVIIGGGLAGIAAASGLRAGGLRVILLEARGQLGGRAISYLDKVSGELIDNCQHVSMGCCTNLHHLAESLGFAEAFVRAKELSFVAP